MDKNNFSDLTSIFNKISPNMNNINKSLKNFNKSCDELDLKKIDDELTEIKKILDANNIDLKNPNNNSKNGLLNSINTKFDYLKNISDDSNTK